MPFWVNNIKGVHRLVNYLRDKDTTDIADLYLFLLSYSNNFFYATYEWKFNPTEFIGYIIIIVDSKDHDRNI